MKHISAPLKEFLITIAGNNEYQLNVLLEKDIISELELLEIKAVNYDA